MVAERLPWGWLEFYKTEVPRCKAGQIYCKYYCKIIIALQYNNVRAKVDFYLKKQLNMLAIDV